MGREGVGFVVVVVLSSCIRPSALLSAFKSRPQGRQGVSELSSWRGAGVPARRARWGRGVASKQIEARALFFFFEAEPSLSL